MRKLSSSAYFCKLSIKLALAMTSTSSPCTFDHLKSTAFSSFSGSAFCLATQCRLAPSLLHFAPRYCDSIQSNCWCLFCSRSKILVEHMRSVCLTALLQNKVNSDVVPPPKLTYMYMFGPNIVEKNFKLV